MSTMKKVLGGVSSSSSSADVWIKQYLSTIERVCNGGQYPYVLNDTVVETLCIKMNKLNGNDRAICVRYVFQHFSFLPHYNLSTARPVCPMKLLLTLTPFFFVPVDTLSTHYPFFVYCQSGQHVRTAYIYERSVHSSA